jgi:hypothetical protein
MYVVNVLSTHDQDISNSLICCLNDKEFVLSMVAFVIIVWYIYFLAS